jgi:hypothetical protein
LVGPVSETVNDSKQDTVYVVMFGLVYISKFGNFAESQPFEMVRPFPETVQDGKQDTTICCIIFDLVCEFKFSNSAESWPIEMVEPVPETVQDSSQDTHVWPCLTLFVLYIWQLC